MEDLFKRFEDIMKINLLKSSKMRLIVANLCNKNFELITKLSNIINVEGIIIKKRWFIKKLIHTIKIYESDHKMFFELTNSLINKKKWKELDVDASEFQKKYFH